MCEKELPKEAIQINYLPIVFENASKSASEYFATWPFIKPAIGPP
jgi:hypothetical protein